MIYLAQKGSEEPVMIGEIAKSYNIPHQFLAKITQTLVKQKLLVTVRGRKGGVKLSRSPSGIYLPEIIQAIEGPPSDQEQCVFGLDMCTDEQPCPFHSKWSVIREQIRDMLESENLAELAKRVDEKHKLMGIYKDVDATGATRDESRPRI